MANWLIWKINRKFRLREALLRYCELDTLAMVEILKKLKAV